MAKVHPYLMFDGACREVMKFYEKCFGGELFLMNYEEMPNQKDAPPDSKGRVVHARLTSGDFMLMASDCPAGQPPTKGNNIHLSISTDTVEELEKLFKAVGEKGKVIQPLHDAFWGAKFGMLVDQFGTHWMFNCEKKK